MKGLGTDWFVSGIVVINRDREAARLLMLPGADEAEFNVTKHLTASEWEAMIRESDAVPVEALVQFKGDAKPARAMIRKCELQVALHTRWAVFRRDNFACRYCGTEDKPLTVDHLVLWKDGGPTTEENLLSACARCNNLRGSMAFGDWLRSKELNSVSKQLPIEVRMANEALLPTLADIPITPIKRKKR